MGALDRITVDAQVMGGRPCVRGLRMPASRILGMLAAGEDEAAIPKDQADLEAEDIRQVLAYVALLSDHQILTLAG